MWCDQIKYHQKAFGWWKICKLLKQIEIKNEIIAEFLLKLAHIGTNINQIAYHININIFENNLENKIAEHLVQIKKICDETQKQIRSAHKVILS